MVRVVRLGHHVGDGQLQLVRPEPVGLADAREPEARARGTAGSRRSGRRRCRRRPGTAARTAAAGCPDRPGVAQRRLTAASRRLARHVDIGRAGSLERQADELAAALDRGPIVELVSHASLRRTSRWGMRLGHALHRGWRQHADGDHLDRIHRRLRRRDCAHALLDEPAAAASPFPWCWRSAPARRSQLNLAGVRGHRRSSLSRSRSVVTGGSSTNRSFASAHAFALAARPLAAGCGRGGTRACSTSRPSRSRVVRGA